MWGTGMRKTPNLTSSDIAACIPIGFCACVAHAGSVLAVSAIILYNINLRHHADVLTSVYKDGSRCRQLCSNCQGM